MAKIVHDDVLCEAHGVCTTIDSARFELDDDEQAHAVDGAIPAGLIPAVERAAASCPVQAIRIEERP